MTDQTYSKTIIFRCPVSKQEFNKEIDQPAKMFMCPCGCGVKFLFWDETGEDPNLMIMCRIHEQDKQ